MRKNLTKVELATVMANPTRLPITDPTPQEYETVADLNALKRDEVRDLMKAALSKPILLR